MSRGIRVHIRVPWWKHRAVGINEAILRMGYYVDVTIGYRDVKGNEVFPGHYFMECSDVERYWTDIEKGVKLFVVPIADFSRERPL